MKTVTTLLRGTILAGGLAFASAASAQEAASANATPDADVAEVLSLDVLDTLSGGDGGKTVVITEQTLTAVNGNNSVVGDVVGSGQVTIGSGAFSGYSGLGNFVINTGHNNNLQSTMSVNVVLPPETP